MICVYAVRAFTINLRERLHVVACEADTLGLLLMVLVLLFASIELFKRRLALGLRDSLWCIDERKCFPVLDTVQTGARLTHTFGSLVQLLAVLPAKHYTVQLK